MSWEFLVTAFLVVVAPGTGALYTLACGLSQGPKAAVVAALGCTLGIVPHLAAALLGVAALIHASALLFESLKVLGALYLLYLAWCMLREGGPVRVDEQEGRTNAGRIVLRAILINLLNPKLSIFFLAFLPQFIDETSPHALQQMLLLSAVFMGLTYVVFVLYGVFAGVMRMHVVERPGVARILQYGFAGAFAALGLRLLTAER
jgi:threonine/homoserine/homoserine lactone efflux protein